MPILLLNEDRHPIPPGGHTVHLTGTSILKNPFPPGRLHKHLLHQLSAFSPYARTADERGALTQATTAKGVTDLQHSLRLYHLYLRWAYASQQSAGTYLTQLAQKHTHNQLIILNCRCLTRTWTPDQQEPPLCHAVTIAHAVLNLSRPPAPPSRSPRA